MTEPRTAAGRALLAQAHLMHKRWPVTDGLIGRHDIIAIEIEAYELGCAATSKALAPTPPDALREAAEYALAFMADPEGLDGLREPVRIALRAALATAKEAGNA